MTIPEPPRPSRRPITRFSPTLLEAIDTCQLQAAFSLDPAFRGLRRPGPAALLGQAAHRLLEHTGRGRFSSVPAAELASVLQAAWDDEMREAAVQLAAGRLVPPPPPSEWPGYELTRVRLLRRLAHRLEQPVSKWPVTTSATVERSLEDRSTGLHGRPDRIEQAGHHVRVVDVKTGLAQSDVRPAQRRQLLLYAYLVFRQLGRWPEEVAVEAVTGERLVEKVQPEEAAAAVEEAITAVHRYNLRVERSPSVLALATPSAEACRTCPFRAVCWPFLQAVQEDWLLLPCFVGVVEEVQEDRRSFLLRAEAPEWRAGKPVRVLGVSDPPKAGQAIGLVDAVTAGEGQVRVRWQTQLVFW